MSTQSFDPYIESLYSLHRPLLDRDGEVRLGRILRRPSPPENDREAFQNDQEEKALARKTFIESNLRLVVHHAKKYARSSGIDISGLISEGNMALMRAVEKFDPERGIKFSTYASWAIIKSYWRYITDTKRGDRLSMVDVADLTQASSPKTKDSSHKQIESREVFMQVVKTVMSGELEITDIDKQDFLDYFGLTADGGYKKRQTLKGTAKRTGVTKERVRQRKNSVIRKLRDAGFGFDGREQLVSV